MMKLFGYWRSMAAYRVRVALNLKGIAVEEIPIAKTFKFEITNAPTVTRILDRCEQLDAFARAHPTRQAGAPLATSN